MLLGGRWPKGRIHIHITPVVGDQSRPLLPSEEDQSRRILQNRTLCCFEMCAREKVKGKSTLELSKIGSCLADHGHREASNDQSGDIFNQFPWPVVISDWAVNVHHHHHHHHGHLRDSFGRAVAKLWECPSFCEVFQPALGCKALRLLCTTILWTNKKTHWSTFDFCMSLPHCGWYT